MDCKTKRVYVTRWRAKLDNKYLRVRMIIMSERHISIECTNYNEKVNEISSSGQACLLNNSILESLADTTKTNAGMKLSSLLDDLCKSSNMHNAHISDHLVTSLTKIIEEYEKLDKASSEAFK